VIWDNFPWTAASPSTTYYLSDGTDEIAEYSSAGALATRYVPGPAIDEPIAMVTSGGTKTYFHANHQGSIVAMSGAGAVLTEGPYIYDPYGSCFSGAAPCSSGEPYRFTGQRLDPETGLYYYRARYYGPGIGRFWQTDPVGYTADLNLYTYVGNDPTDKEDPSGAMNQPVSSACALMGSECEVTDYGNAGSTNSGKPKLRTHGKNGDIQVADADTAAPAIGVGGIALGLACAAAEPCPAIAAVVGGAAILAGGIVLINKIPNDAKNPDGAKAPGKPGPANGFEDPKSGEQWNGRGWVDNKGRVWEPTGWAGARGTGTTGPAHGGPHWDVQKPGGYVNVRPGENINDK
jgi:RHS repeat-associated protein